MLLSAYSKVRTTNYTGPVVLDCGDTGVYVQAAYVSHQIRGDLLIKHKNGFITGSGHSSGFYGHGKNRRR